MNVLILYSISHQEILMRSLCQQICNAGVCADLLDVTSLVFFSPSGRKAPRLIQLYRKSFSVLHRDRITLWLVCRMAEKYDVIDFQGLFTPLFYTISKILKKRGKAIKTHFWGTDLTLAKSYDKSWKGKVLENSKLVQVATEEMKGHVADKFHDYLDRTVVCPFGNQHLDDLRELMEEGGQMDLGFTKMILTGKIVVCCGYNGKETQQHIKMIRALGALPVDVQKKLAVVFPMTYELEEEYLAAVQDELKGVAFSYDIIIQRMTELQLLSLRKISDIVVNIQVIDSLSASLQEHIFCGGVLIAGEWLPYSLFTDHGIYYIKSGVSDLSEKLLDTIQNLDTLKRKCEDNGQRIYALTSWQAVIERWKDIYLRLDNS